MIRLQPTETRFVEIVHEKEWVNRGECFWGRSTVAIDCPAIVGAVSHDGSKAVAIGYQYATSASQNADGHHCLHSRPHFGDIVPEQSVTRGGLILFGEEFAGLAERLREQLGRSGNFAEQNAGDGR